MVVLPSAFLQMPPVSDKPSAADTDQRPLIFNVIADHVKFTVGLKVSPGNSQVSFHQTI